MIRKVFCLVLDCDDCRVPLTDEGNTVVLHFDTDREALDHLIAQGWTVSEDGWIRCPRCTAEHRAQQLCHDLHHLWSPWKVCVCAGAIRRHKIDGCPLVRACAQCGALEEATLDRLPTTTEPTTTDGPPARG